MIINVGISFGEMKQILLLATFPVVFELGYNRILDLLSHLVRRVLVGYDLHFYLAFVGLAVLLLLLLGPHLSEVVDALPDEAVILGLENRVEVVGLCGLQNAFVSDFFFLLVDVLKISWLVQHIECLVVHIKEHLFEL